MRQRYCSFPGPVLIDYFYDDVVINWRWNAVWDRGEGLFTRCFNHCVQTTNPKHYTWFMGHMHRDKSRLSSLAQRWRERACLEEIQTPPSGIIYGIPRNPGENAAEHSNDMCRLQERCKWGEWCKGGGRIEGVLERSCEMPGGFYA